MANEYYIINPNIDKEKRLKQIFEFIQDKQFYCAVAYAKVCKLREDEWNKVNNTKDDYFNKLYTLLAYAFDDPWYGAKAYDNFDFKKKKIEDKDYSSFKDNNFIKLSFLAITIRVLYCQNFGNFEISNDSYYKQLKLENVIEDIVNFKKATGKVLAVYADKKQVFKNRKNDIDSIENEQDNLENERKRFSIGNTELENILREDIFSDTNSLAYSFYKKAIKDKKQDFLLEDDNEYLKKFLDDDDYYNNLDLTISFDKIQDFVKERYNKKLKNLKNAKEFQNSDQYNTVSYDLEKFLKDVMNFLDKCVNDLSNTYEDKADKKYNKEWSSYVEHLENTLDKLEEDIKLKSDNKEIAGICVLEYVCEYIKNLISMDIEEDDYRYEYDNYFYAPFLLSNLVMLNDKFCPDFPIIYQEQKKKIENSFVETIQPEYRIMKQAEEFKTFNYTIGNFKQELRYKQNNNNKHNYYSKSLIAKYDDSCKLDENARDIDKAKKRALGKLEDFQGELELALWYRQLEESLQLEEKLNKISENRAYKLYLNMRDNIDKWHDLLCEKSSNYDFFNDIVEGYLDYIKTNIKKLKKDSLGEFKKINDNKDDSHKEKAFFEQFYNILQKRIDEKDNNLSFKNILDSFSEDKYKKDEYKDIREFFEQFYNIVFKQQNFSNFSKFLKNFSDSFWNKLGSDSLDNSLDEFVDDQMYNDCLNNAEIIDDDTSFHSRVILGKDSSDHTSAKKIAKDWDNIFLSNKNKIDDILLGNLLAGLGFGEKTIIKRDSKITFLSSDENQVFLNNFLVKLLPKSFNNPITAFASDAVNNPFRVICIDRNKINDNTVDYLINFIKNLETKTHTMILFDYALTREDRRTLAKKIKIEINSNGENNTLFLVIDRVLITFLMKKYNADKINEMLLYVASPFGYYQPYKPSKGFGASDEDSLDEMFIGRSEELENIKNLEIPIHIVYGGRQLGKTSLLQRATRDINKNNGSIAVYLRLSTEDEKNDLVNDDYYTREALDRIVRYMKLSKVFKENIEINSWDDFEKKVESVLESKENNISSLVLLIDEADNFFESCDKKKTNKPFDVFDKIVSYAKKCQKKFKVVFAGLNMIKDYKFLNIGNHTGGQLDDKNYISIAPFNDKEARELIEKPLRYLGLYFAQDSESLIYLILDKTNYYPCLIQLYCEKLLKDMCREDYAHYREEKDPVYYVSKAHIKTILSDKGFLETVKKKFDITLDLSPTDSKEDHTYRYLALILAYLCYNNEKGYSFYNVDDFVNVAKEYNIQHICDLYEQKKLETYIKHLVELSVFSEEEQGIKRYGFRRLPLWQLMGDKDKIENDIMSFIS